MEKVTFFPSMKDNTLITRFNNKYAFVSRSCRVQPEEGKIYDVVNAVPHKNVYYLDIQEALCPEVVVVCGFDAVKSLPGQEPYVYAKLYNVGGALPKTGEEWLARVLSERKVYLIKCLKSEADLAREYHEREQARERKQFAGKTYNEMLAFLHDRYPLSDSEDKIQQILYHDVPELDKYLAAPRECNTSYYPANTGPGTSENDIHYCFPTEADLIIMFEACLRQVDHLKRQREEQEQKTLRLQQHLRDICHSLNALVSEEEPFYFALSFFRSKPDGVNICSRIHKDSEPEDIALSVLKNLRKESCRQFLLDHLEEYREWAQEEWTTHVHIQGFSDSFYNKRVDRLEEGRPFTGGHDD